MFERMETAEQIYKCGSTSKNKTGKKSTVPVMELNVRGYNPPLQPTPRRSAPASTRHIMQAIQAIGWLVQKHA